MILVCEWWPDWYNCSLHCHSIHLFNSGHCSKRQRQPPFNDHYHGEGWSCYILNCLLYGAILNKHQLANCLNIWYTVYISDMRPIICGVSGENECNKHSTMHCPSAAITCYNNHEQFILMGVWPMTWAPFSSSGPSIDSCYTAPDDE